MGVAGLQRELEERDMMIANLNLSSSASSVISSPFVMSPHGGSPGDSPGNSTPPAGFSEGYSSAGSYLHEQLSAKENKVIQLNGEVAELRRKVFDLEENLAEKEQVRQFQHQASCNFSSRSSLHEQPQLVWPLPVLQPKAETPWISWRILARS